MKKNYYLFAQKVVHLSVELTSPDCLGCETKGAVRKSRPDDWRIESARARQMDTSLVQAHRAKSPNYRLEH